MSRPTRRPRLLALGAAALVALAGCTGGSAAAAGGSASSSAAPTDPAAYGEPVGPGCAGTPDAPKKGSFAWMAGQPVADAVAGSPILKTFAKALKGDPDLVGQLGKANGVTLFVPYDAAFAQVPKKNVTSLLTNPKRRTALLDYAVVAEQLLPPQLSGGTAYPTLVGPSTTLSFEVVNGVVKLNGTANVVCSNIVTANATIYVTDKVILPPQ